MVAFYGNRFYIWPDLKWSQWPLPLGSAPALTSLFVGFIAFMEVIKIPRTVRCAPARAGLAVHHRRAVFDAHFFTISKIRVAGIDEDLCAPSCRRACYAVLISFKHILFNFASGEPARLIHIPLYSLSWTKRKSRLKPN